MKMSARVIVLARVPIPGQVKSRLSAEVGPAKATAIYREVAERVFRNIERIEKVEIHYAPASFTPELEEWRKRWPRWNWTPQVDGDLGARLAAIIQAHFAGSRDVLLLMGSDCPLVTPDLLLDAETQLATHDLVVGPAEDGGYWLIGMKQPQPELFKEMPWGTKLVFQKTMDRARQQGLCVGLLPELYDIDELKDWERMKNSQ